MQTITLNTDIDTPDRLLTRQEAAALLCMSPKTLANWAVMGKGPEFFSYGDGWVRYQKSDLAAWLETTRVKAVA